MFPHIKLHPSRGRAARRSGASGDAEHQTLSALLL